MIYYAGHGDLDRQYDDGWWIPVDAKAGDPVTYLDNIQVQKAMRSMNARHVLLISDSCYSGSLFGRARAIPPVINSRYYLGLYNEKSRWGMTSGNKTPVADDGTGGHSVFAYQLIKELRKNSKKYLSTQELYTRIAPIVSNNSEQTPMCRPIRNTGDQGGEFVFIASSGAVVYAPSKSKASAFLSVEANVKGARVLVDGRDIGLTDLSRVKVSTGEHLVRVEKDGYEAYIKRMNFEKGRSMSMFVVLNPKSSPKSRLYIDTQPGSAKVRILNIGPGFYQGMDLEAGRYHVEVSATGFKTKTLWVNLSAGEDKNLDIRLSPVSDSESAGKFTNSLGMEFVYIKPGTFMMGSPSSEPGRDSDERQHQVTLTKGFYMQTAEVTIDQWRRFVSATGYRSEAETQGWAWIWTGKKWEKGKGYYWDKTGFSQNDNQHVTCVSWNDVQKYIRWLNRKEGKIYKLPTEAEWEYAARAGSTTAFTNGGISETGCGYDSNLDAMGWYCGNSDKRTHRVAGKKPNRWGLYDMHGNVWEWCQDWYGKNYPSDSVIDPTGPSSGSLRVGRGGSWSNFARRCRSAVRGNFLFNN